MTMSVKALILGLVMLVGGCADLHKTTKPIPTTGEPSAGSNASEALMAAQAPLVAAAEKIRKIDPAGTGLGGIRLQVKEHVLDVWWKGNVPAALHEEIGRQEREGVIKVTLRAAKYSQRELDEAAKTIVTNRNSYPGRLVRVTPHFDGSGLEVAFDEITGVVHVDSPVDTNVVQAPSVTQTSRANDSPPWWAGGVTRPMMNVTGMSPCSTGFAVHRLFFGWETSRGILTANHCYPSGNVWFSDGAGDPIGLAEPRPTGTGWLTDSLYITTNSGARIFDGGVGVGEFSKPVVGSTSLFPGQFVCTSGAATGVHCDIRIDSINNHSVLLLPSLSFVDGVALASQVSGAVATGVGDSGGPVFTLAWPDPSKVLAAGMMVGGLNSTQCQIAGQTGCFSRVAFVDIYMILLNHDASLLTQ